MVATQYDNLLGVSDLKCEQKTDNFATLLSSVDIVSHEQVSCVFRNDVVLLFLLVFVPHFFEHMK
jgi:hypothetical protein